MRNLGRGYEIPVPWRAPSSLWPLMSNPWIYPASGRGRFLWKISFSSRQESTLPAGGCGQSSPDGSGMWARETSQLGVHPEVLGRVTGLQSRLHPEGFLNGRALPRLSGCGRRQHWRYPGNFGAFKGSRSFPEHPTVAAAMGGLGLWGISPWNSASLQGGAG